MKIFPAIDLKDGKAVRLLRGDYNRVTVCDDCPARAAERFAAAGADCLHLVDLDGAKEGRPVNGAAIAEILSARAFFTEIGGGIRDEARIEAYLSMGVDRVILGTAAIKDFDFTARMTARYGARIAVGVDARDGFVAIGGWLETTDVPAEAFCARLADIGVQTVVFTDIFKDGALQGTNIELYHRLCGKKPDIVASGGVTYLREIDELRKIGAAGVILGKALYAGKLDLREAITHAEGIC